MKKVFAIALLIALLCALVSCGEALGEPTAAHTVNGFSIELFETEGIVTAVRLVSPTGKSTISKCKGKNFTPIDLNFDGYDDLRLDDTEHEGQFLVWLYQPKSHAYSFSRALSDLIDPVYDAEAKIISARIHKIEYYSEREGEVSGYRETRGQATYEFISGTLTQKSESGIYHDSDGELYCVYEAEFVNGELIYDYGKEKWYYLDELTAAGYKW